MDPLVRALRDSGKAVVELVIDAQGRVRGCQVLEATYNDRDSRRICSVLDKIEYRSPGIGSDGERTYARLLVAFNIGDHEPVLRPPDVLMTTDRLSLSPGDKMRTNVVLHVGADGHPLHCGLPTDNEPSSSGFACEQSRKLRFDPVVDDDGVAVPFVTSVTFEFTGAAPS